MTLEGMEVSLSTVISSTLTVVLALNGLFIKWLVSNFHKIEGSMKEMLEFFRSHENEDQKRHEENLYRFERVSVALAKLGSDNGTYEKKD